MIYSNLEEYRKIINEETSPTVYENAVEFMKEIHHEITSRISSMTERRNKMEEDTLVLLEQVFKSLSRGATS